jgi:hypothetical protein
MTRPHTSPQLQRQTYCVLSRLIFIIDDGSYQLYMLDVAIIQLSILQDHQDMLAASHPRVHHILHSLQAQMYWPGMRKHVEECAHSCWYFHLNKSAAQAPGIITTSALLRSPFVLGSPLTWLALAFLEPQVDASELPSNGSFLGTIEIICQKYFEVFNVDTLPAPLTMPRLFNFPTQTNSNRPWQPSTLV